MKISIKIVLAYFLLITPHLLQAQKAETLTLQQCYNWAEENYPLIKQHELINQSSDFSIQNLQKNNLPQISVNGQASYQNEVTSIPIALPNMNIETLDKDQYKIYADVNQTLYNGGQTRKQVKLEKANQEVQEKKLEVDLYKIKQQINQLYFGIIMLREQIRLNGLLENDIQLAIDQTQVRLENGTVIESDLYTLQAQLLSVQQNTIEINALESAYYQMLGLFINKEVTENTQLQKPELLPNTDSTVNRPELKLFDSQLSALDLKDDLIGNSLMPRVSLFAQGGYGKPGLNMLSNNFDVFAIGGIRLKWNLFSFYTHKNDVQINSLKKEEIKVQRETFLFNTEQEITRQNNEIEKYQKLLESDEAIIKMYANVKETSHFKLENGVQDVNDYLRDVNQENKARQNKVLHEIKYLMAIAEQKITKGI